MIDKQIMKLPGMKQLLGLLAGLSFLQALFIIGQAYGLARAITGLWEGRPLEEQWGWILLFFCSFIARQAVIYFRSKRLDDYSYQQAADLRDQLLEKLFRVGPQIAQQQGTGNVTTMVLEGINQVENYLKLILAKIMNMSIIPWVILALVFYLDWESGLVLLLVFPLIIIFMIILGYAAQSKAEKQYRTFQLLSNHFIDSLRGIDTLKLFGVSKKYGKSIFASSERFRKATMASLKVGILSTFALDFFTTLSIAVVAVLLGLRLINEGILLFPALTILILAPEYFLPIRDFSSDYHATLDGKNAMTAVTEILHQPEAQVPAVTVPRWQEDAQLTIDQLAFSYEEKAALTDINLNVTGFKKIGIIGLSGSGKSTLINTLSGFLVPDSGEISLGGAKTTAFRQASWQEQLIYIPQNPYIYRLTLQENVAFYQPTATKEAVLKAIEVAGLTELLAELPQGLDTMLGEGERHLSGGQAQRIALARAFLDQQRKILLFDEPTAHLDIETEVALKERMLPLMENRLVFFATHRLHWMEEMDEIIVMDQGRIVEQGTLAQLQQKQGAFTELVNGMRREQLE
ncbi:MULTISPECIES: thiol reductant ABC exporter subunit CydD [Enterococcus]|jgi:ATP-binding cassette subfamily C protein CydD|uniref:Thiol reductant ABC exporter, CydD subunit n=1 Tax=Enterococcus casseliflavus EC20 TaxID=565655 RepID=C9A8Y9_ENTCA|nr:MULTISPECIES: thiol reductant ABC exporter subunit CydD [Enterococcus]AYJ44221.1 thiol reductant ABC exporter subunit CydD [Enterococcus casseliflavus]EEV38950.1 thiol reductant ABC exporter, CydD subunit [Enterococcus casseliflavus EC20]EPH64819.1 thiol reductant ABC exporter, CydD subunit [Enterococcus casseliflavus 14-MB-W-14]MBK0037394.1 thiol reductant ABC exporter subunit CydD [Enterococcus sp. S52]MBK0070057.1 thiol reductant ABC exporter subunit CydD [Enterococcus sp. S53]